MSCSLLTSNSIYHSDSTLSEVERLIANNHLIPLKDNDLSGRSFLNPAAVVIVREEL